MYVSTFKQSRFGFTLIELLVVVAIIGILAAIAIPNFLQAQTRAKVARSLADMASQATALEAYRVDSSNYPPDWFQTFNPFFMDTTLSLRVITTPIDYISTLPESAFGAYGTTIPAVPPGTEFKQYVYEGPYAIEGFYSSLPPSALPYDISARAWVLASPGPDRIFESGGQIYDPTNGTISDGNVYRLGPGSPFP
jgi:general secretion pathway protein G